MTAAAVAGAPGTRASPPRLRGAGRPGWRRPAALVAALLALALAGVGALVASRALAPPEAEAEVARLAAPAPGAAPMASAAPPARQAPGRPAPERVVAPAHAAALFAPHTWYVRPPKPPPPPPARPPPPPEPTAPPFPYAFVGSYAPEGRPPVYFLARGDRVIDVHVGDRLDGVYQLESAADGQLVFVYLPLNVRHQLGLGVPR